jgi:vitamin B12 transporter
MLNSFCSWIGRRSYLTLAVISSFLGFQTLGNGLERTVELDPWYVFGSGASIGSGERNDAWSRDWISAEGMQSALEATPGLFLSQPGGNAGRSEIMIRGGESNFTKTYVEGMEVNDPVDSRGGGFQWNHLDPFLIGEVSLISGSQAARYGSDALSGVLLASFPRAEQADPHWTLGASVGGRGRSSWSAGGNQAWDSLGIRAHLAHSEEEDLYPGTRFRNTSAFVKLHHLRGESYEASFAAWGGDSLRKSFPDESGGPSLAVWRTLDEVRSRDWGGSLVGRAVLTDALSWRGHAGFYRLNKETDSPGVAPGPRSPIGVPANRYDSSLRRFQIEQSLLWHPRACFQLTAGLGWKQEEGTSVGQLSLPWVRLPETRFSENRELWSVFGEATITLPDDWMLSLAHRLDRTSGFESRATPSLWLSKSWDEEQTRAQVSYSEGFKVPGLFALNDALVGNPELRSERVHSWDVSLNHGIPRLRTSLRVTAFSQEYRDLIDFSEVSSRLENLESVRSKGVELSLESRWTKVLLSRSGFTWMDVDTGVSGEVLRHRPEWMGHLILEIQADIKTRVQLAGRWIGARWDSSVPTGNVLLESYHLLDLRVQRRVGVAGMVELSLINVLDLRKSTYLGYPLPGTQVQLGARWAF